MEQQCAMKAKLRPYFYLRLYLWYTGCGDQAHLDHHRFKRHAPHLSAHHKELTLFKKCFNTVCARYNLTTPHCMQCGSTLTDQKSIAAALSSTCHAISLGKGLAPVNAMQRSAR
eukprot:6207412-Pleurochrysis_carterae.AAC.9